MKRAELRNPVLVLFSRYWKKNLHALRRYAADEDCVEIWSISQDDLNLVSSLVKFKNKPVLKLLALSDEDRDVGRKIAVELLHKQVNSIFSKLRIKMDDKLKSFLIRRLSVGVFTSDVQSLLVLKRQAADLQRDVVFSQNSLERQQIVSVCGKEWSSQIAFISSEASWVENRLPSFLGFLRGYFDRGLYRIDQSSTAWIRDSTVLGIRAVLAYPIDFLLSSLIRFVGQRKVARGRTRKMGVTFCDTRSAAAVLETRNRIYSNLSRAADELSVPHEFFTLSTKPFSENYQRLFAEHTSDMKCDREALTLGRPWINVILGRIRPGVLCYSPLRFWMSSGFFGADNFSHRHCIKEISDLMSDCLKLHFSMERFQFNNIVGLIDTDILSMIQSLSDRFALGIRVHAIQFGTAAFQYSYDCVNFKKLFVTDDMALDVYRRQAFGANEILVSGSPEAELSLVELDAESENFIRSHSKVLIFYDQFFSSTLSEMIPSKSRRELWRWMAQLGSNHPGLGVVVKPHPRSNAPLLDAPDDLGKHLHILRRGALSSHFISKVVCAATYFSNAVDVAMELGIPGLLFFSNQNPHAAGLISKARDLGGGGCDSLEEAERLLSPLLSRDDFAVRGKAEFRPSREIILEAISAENGLSGET